ncbi:hypothetical protein Ocin01_03374 [Orchesella cincta]|uniref:DUF5077 domain-containing protein n=1 Tax=Orchesella cincta TaxID=48709 RepID=A0A1D2NE95_ORCCI|nr:hypothetical protein Ocin01_03374 [Orchesella cincta]
MCSNKKSVCIIPFGGNAFITKSESSAKELITPCGIASWTSSSTVISLYFHSQYPGRVLAALRLRVPEGSSNVNVILAHNDSSAVTPTAAREVSLQGADFQLVNCGMFSIPKAGYTRLDIQGVEKTGPFYAEVSHVVLVSEFDSLLEPMHLRFVDDPADFYFGRRGPSVHLSYPLPEASDTEYFYNEIYVPKGQDLVGAYFCAMGFSGGYFGIQVNSSEERRVLFSVWSEYSTDIPGEIPEEYKVNLIRKGEDVYVGEFGNEGSGAQSYLQYMWEPEKSYKFIVHARPINEEHTMYTAWFNDGSSPNAWNLIASFDKPKVSTFFKGPYSFSENFIPEMGYQERHCLFANQWACDSTGNWTELTKANFTADATAAKETRMDVSGGVGIDGDRTKFFLRNCGFFSDRVPPGSPFERESSGDLPPVDVSLLP